MDMSVNKYLGKYVSLDLTPMDIFLWGYLKHKVYQTVPPNVQDLRKRITREVIARRRVHLVRPSFDSMRARAQICLAHFMELRLKAEQGGFKDSKYLT